MNRACALVTGASRGIGAAIVTALAAEGFDVIVNYARSQDDAERVSEACRDLGVCAIPVQADVSDETARARLVSETKERFGRLDVLVNNAGVAPTIREDILDLSSESYDRLLAINLSGAFWLTQDVSRWMIEQRQRHSGRAFTVINITSISSSVSSPNRAAYCISKAGLSMATKLFADRLASEGIFVYEVQPGIIRTDMTDGVQEKYEQLIGDGLLPIARWGRPEDVASAVAVLATGKLGYSTGEVLRIDGGFHIRRLH